jgi:hypothetical protein
VQMAGSTMEQRGAVPTSFPEVRYNTVLSSSIRGNEQFPSLPGTYLPYQLHQEFKAQTHHPDPDNPAR